VVKRRQFPNKRQQRSAPRPPPTVDFGAVLAARRAEPKREYGRPFILMEDESLNTFHYVSGAWIPYEKKIAECRLDCQVKALPQKVNKMIRYEVRAPI
jgi:hypothetical protein